MRAPLCLLLLVAHAVDMLALNRRKKQVGTGLGGNCTGCIICSEENGCSTCQQRLFLFIRREGIRQYGKCLHDCPPGYFGIRGQEVNRCKKCGATCESCFSQDFCIRCKRQFYLYKGKCLPTCPPGTLAHQNTRECQGECELGPWGGWSPCTHNGKTCGSAWGLESRVREAGRAGHEEAATCQVLSESRKCPIQRPCPGGEPQDRHTRLRWERPTGTGRTQITAPQIVSMRLPERPPLAILSCGVHITFPGVLSKEGLPCWVQSQIH
ncbi:R-spondin-4 isoform X1 [Homo sapiens]|uniref:R-spondin-4 isoform X1 n=1 Tax=Homo sapiens TaxID=9606 RepID=UPI0003EAEFEE|nr:R-spondin-4 isoform X1 [Homo sapiens]XP_054179381.1 R-spondin-4 isoform X1 [Homo sapiens]|eukprot:XP_016883328.1 R-spondin-4 isoform X1 [Homo sapiens]